MSFLSSPLLSTLTSQSTPIIASFFLHNRVFSSSQFDCIDTAREDKNKNWTGDLQLLPQIGPDLLWSSGDSERPRETQTANSELYRLGLVHYCTAELGYTDFITDIARLISQLFVLHHHQLPHHPPSLPLTPHPRAKDTWGAKCVLYGWKAWDGQIV